MGKTKAELDRTVLTVMDELEVTSTFTDDMPRIYGNNWYVDSEIGKLRAVMLHRPGREFELIQGKDPKMLSMHEIPDVKKMQDEFDAIKEMYESNGVKVYLLEDLDEDCPNGLFCRDLMNGTPNGMLMSRMAINVRSPEVKCAARELGRYGVPICKMVNGAGTFEGACLIWLDRETVFIGRGTRSNDAGVKQVVDELTNQGVKNFIHIDIPRNAVHLDGMLAIADYDVAVTFAYQTPHTVYQELKRRGFRIVEIPTWEEQALAANFVALEPGKIAMCKGYPLTKKLLEDEGVEVIEVQVDEIRKAAGAIHCMTAFLQRDPVPVYDLKW